ncbi:MAG: twin-arginine translocation pathway signal protein [Pseudomonadota bacterium]
MTLTRRKTIAIIGGGAILAAGGATGYTVTRKPQIALSPWAEAGAYDEPRRRALSYAVLAPNPHNRQPWMVDLATDGSVALYVDTDRLLPHTDPFGRQIVVGLGCFLETMALAAAQDGYRIEMDLFPDGSDPERLDARPVAVARFLKGGAQPEPQLFDQVLLRRSLKEGYDTARPVADEALTALRAAAVHGGMVETTNQAEKVAEIRQITADAFTTEFETPRTYKESVDLFRIGHREVDANPDGIDFSGPMFETLHMTGLFTRDRALDTSSVSYRSGLSMVHENAKTGMAYIWQVTSTNTRDEQIAAGRDWVRINLAASALGLGVQPMSQALQEFPEMASNYQMVHGLLAPEGGVVQMLGRLGYGPEVPQSPRWPLEAKILDG